MRARFVTRTLWLAGAAVALAVAAPLHAQAPAAPQQAPPQQQQPPPGVLVPTQREVIRRNIDLVTTDVIVRDGNGQFVADLKKDDFEVFEDGVEQDIASLTLVHGGRVFNCRRRRRRRRRKASSCRRARPTNDAAGRIFLLLRRRPAPRLPQHRPHPRPVQEDLEDADPRRRHVRHRLDRAVVAGDRHDLRPEAARRGDQEDQPATA